MESEPLSESTNQMNSKQVPMSQLEGFVFIATYGRSGSTLLQSVINTIPGYEIRGENHNALFSLYESWKAINTGFELSGYNDWKDAIQPDNPWWGLQNISTDAYGKKLAEVFCESILQPSPGTRVSGFKEIRFHRVNEALYGYLRFIRQFFPNSRFVFNFRGLEQTARSGWWATMERDSVMIMLSAAKARYEWFAQDNPEFCFCVEYEQYTKDAQSLEPLFDFLGESFDQEAVETVLNRRLNHGFERK